MDAWINGRKRGRTDGTHVLTSFFFVKLRRDNASFRFGWWCGLYDGETRFLTVIGIATRLVEACLAYMRDAEMGVRDRKTRTRPRGVASCEVAQNTLGASMAMWFVFGQVGHSKGRGDSDGAC